MEKIDILDDSNRTLMASKVLAGIGHMLTILRSVRTATALVILGRHGRRDLRGLESGMSD